MLFNSIEYLFFLPIIFLIYWTIGYARINDSLKLRMQNIFLLLASYVFYAWWDYRFLLLLVGMSLIAYISGYAIVNSEKLRVNSKACLIANIIIDLGVLAVFKYYNFFVGSFADLFGLQNTIHSLKIVLPLGISFFTFQAISYVVDVYKRKIEPTNIVDCLLYIGFFPKLLAGPIERPTNLIPQIQKSRVFEYDLAVDGCRQMLWGLFKKVVIADNCALYVNQVYGDYANQSGSTLLLAAILYTIQIYGDFSGYSDMAIGSAKLLGFRFRDNFLFPYFSRNMNEFWRRWHISLNTWFVDYVYIPLGGSRPDLKTKTQINTVPDINIDKLSNQKIIEKNTELSDTYSIPNSIDHQFAREQAPGQPNAQSYLIDSVAQTLSDNSSQKIPKNSKNERLRKVITCRNIMIVFLLSGLWHGADWSFVAWGAYHGLLLVLLILLNRNTKYEHVVAYDKVLPSFKELGQMLLVFALATFGWMMFRADNMTQFIDYTRHMCSADLLSVPFLINRDFYMPLTLWLAIMFITEWLMRNKRHGLDIASLPPYVRYIIYLVVIFIVGIFGGHTTNYIYFQF